MIRFYIIIKYISYSGTFNFMFDESVFSERSVACPAFLLSFFPVISFIWIIAKKRKNKLYEGALKSRVGQL